MALTLPTLVQQNTAASSVASPASITPTLSTASTAGNLLLISVTVSGSSPSAAVPAGWALVSQGTAGAFQTSVFSRVSNPGGITAVAITLSNDTNGGAVATIFEFSSMGSSTVELVTGTFNTGGASVNLNPLALPADYNELVFLTTGGQSGITTTPADTSFSSVIGGTSTVATTNVTLSSFWYVAAVSNTNGLVSFNTNSTNFTILARFLSLASSAISRNAQGNFVGQSLNPAGSLQVPQPIAPGSFFSGTTGSF